MPGGVDAAHATLISTLPFTDTDTVPTTAGLWYKYVGMGFPNEISVFSYSSSSAQRLAIFSPDSITAYPPPNPVSFIINRPLQIPVSNGVTYYFKIYNQVGPYTLSVIAAPFEAIPVGSIFVNDDKGGWPLALLSGTDGHVLRFVNPFPAGESGDVITSGDNIGNILVHDRLAVGGNDHLKLYSPQIALLADLDYTSDPSFGAIYPIRACGDKFYVAKPQDPLNSNHPSVTTVNGDGTFGGTTWNLSSTYGLAGIAPSIDETILYTRRLTSSGGARAVGRWDLVGNLELSNLAAEISGWFLDDILVLANDTILVAYKWHTANVTPFVRRFAPDGTILNTYTLTGSQSQDLRLASALDDPNSFWVWTKTNAGETLSGGTTLNKFTNIHFSDGAILHSFSVPQFSFGSYAEAASATPSARFGASESCPFLLTRVLIPVPTGRLIVNKIAVPSYDTTAQNFESDQGGFSLLPGETETFEDVPVGLHTVTENPSDDWRTEYDPVNNTNLIVNEGEDTVLNVTNTRLYNRLSGVYQMVPGKTNDTYHVRLGETEDTIDVKIPDPYIVVPTE